MKADPGYGKLREPVLYVTAAARALGSATDGFFLAQQAKAQGEDLFNAPSVFNYYPPGYVVPGTSANGPEFALLNAATAIERYNFANTLSFAAAIPPLTTWAGATGTLANWSALQALAANPQALVDELDALLLHGTMSQAMRSTLLGAIASIPASNPQLRAKTAFYLAISAPEYQVER